MSVATDRAPKLRQRRTLGEVVEFLDSKRVPITARDRKPGPYPYYGANGLQDHVADYIFDEKLVLLAEDGGNFEDPTRPISYLVEGKCWVNNHAHVLRATSAISPEYLNYQIAFANVSAFLSGTTRPKLTKSDASRIPLVVPPLDEQRRVVDLLSRAENIVRMRREAEAKAKAVIPALFLDMFGDPGTNPKGWVIEPLADVVAIESPLRTPNLVTEASEVCIGPDSIESRTGQLINQPTVGEIRPISGKYRYQAGNVLYSKIRPALVKATLAPSDGYCSADMYPLSCGPKLKSEYLLQILLDQHFTRYALDRATRAQMPKINREALFRYPLPVPPVQLQEAFAEHCSRTQGLCMQQREASMRADSAFQSLLAGVFGEGR
jgi:type I restriction enzyme S subunit